MAKTLAKILGLVLLVVGVLGFTHVLDPLHATLSPAHNMVHIVTGIIALYFGFNTSMSATRRFCFVFGIVYLLLGVLGYLLGDAADMHALNLRFLTLHDRDHMIHIAVGALFLVGGLLSGRDA